MKRDSYMDLLKGILIILVIVGHTTAHAGNMTILYNIIYSFHMPFMIYISGYIEEINAEKYSQAKYKMILARVNSLLIPYTVWVFIDCIRNLVDNPFGWKIFIDRLMGYTQSGLWFLAVLFGLKIMHVLLWILKGKKYERIIDAIINIAVLGLLEIMLMLIAYISKFPYLINMISYAIPYFLGVLMVRDEMIKKITKKKVVVALCMIVYIVGIRWFSFYNTNWTTQLLRIILSCSMIIMAMSLKEKVAVDNVWIEKICILGKNSMIIYLLHGVFIDYGSLISKVDSVFIAGVLHICLAVMVGVVCIILGKILCKLPYVGRLLFGIE